MKTAALLLVIPLLNVGLLRADLGTSLKDPQIWQRPAAEFVGPQAGTGLDWTSTAQSSAAMNPRTASETQLAGLPILDGMMLASNETPARFQFTFYNRGDSGDLTKPEFGELIAKAREAINGWLGTSPAGEPVRNQSVVRTEHLLWQLPHAAYYLEWSFTDEVRTQNVPFRAEFLRLRVQPEADGPQLTIAQRNAAMRGNTSTIAKPEPDATGARIIKNIPMVDQGQKGYCVVATAERVFRYYERDADQHELAQIANSSASEGTSMDEMYEALRSLTSRLNVKVQEHYQLDYQALRRMTDNYNRLAKRDRAKTIDIRTFVSFDDIYQAMDNERLVQARVEDRSGASRFQRDVQNSIDSGVPVLWTVRLGVVPEPNTSQSGGGHMRLIIGYNPEEQLIYYSDSWGPGHEEKVMEQDDAWAITTGMYSIEPRQ